MFVMNGKIGNLKKEIDYEEEPNTDFTTRKWNTKSKKFTGWP